MASDVGSLKSQAERFAQDLTNTVQSVAPHSDAFVAIAIQTQSRFSVRQHPNVGIPLHVKGEPLLSLTVEFRCALDRRGAFLAVEQSKVAVYAGQKASGEPLFRYEYERNATSVPAAHIQVHAHRDAFTHAMTRAGTETPRGNRRALGKAVPSLSQLHFPVGGHRFRPSLEDVLEMLVDEFGIDGAKEAKRVLAEGREKWRRTQTKAVVRDDPQSAVSVLRELGYAVTWPAEHDEPQKNRDRLQQR